jgi:hypothetical protein
MTDQPRIVIPHNAAGRLAFDAFRTIAEKMLKTGNEATSDFALTHFPESKTVSKEYSDGIFQRIMQTTSGTYISIMYNYATQTTAATYLPHWKPRKRFYQTPLAEVI